MDRFRDLVRLVAIACALAVVGLVGPLASPQPANAAAIGQSQWQDYNDDGESDLAIGIPNETIGGQAGAGAVQILYGANPDGFNTATANLDFFHENNLETVDGPSANDHFGAALSSGDFDDDGFSDLAIGIPGEDRPVSNGTDRGAVVILWGSASGLQEDTNVPVGTGLGKNYGQSLLAINTFHPTMNAANQSDGVADLVVANDSGITILVGGTRNFMAATSPRRVSLRGEDNLTSFRFVLAAGNLDGDLPEELIVGMPDKAVDGKAGAGSMALIDHDPVNPTVSDLDIDLFTQDDIGRTSVAGDNFGAAAAIGNTVGPDEEEETLEELIVGAPGRNITFNGTSRDNAGTVYFFASTGLSAVPLTQASTDIPDNPEAGDRFGAALLIGGFGGLNGGLGVAIGVPGEQLGSVDGAGAVVIIDLNANVGDDRMYLLSQNTTGMPGTAQANDNFGATLASGGDYDGVGDSDLAIGVPNDNPNGINNAGSVNVVYHNFDRLAPRDGDRLWNQATTNVADAPESNDRFGGSLH